MHRGYSGGMIDGNGTQAAPLQRLIGAQTQCTAECAVDNSRAELAIRPLLVDLEAATGTQTLDVPLTPIVRQGRQRWTAPS